MSLMGLDKSFDQLEQIKNFDPVRFTLIQSMYERLNKSQHRTNQTLIRNIEDKITSYQNDFSQNQIVANATLNVVKNELPDHIEHVTQLSNTKQFKQIESYVLRCKSKINRQQFLSQLISLKNDISHSATFAKDTELPLSIDDILFNQEQQARVETGSAPLPSNNNKLTFELESMKQHRESVKYFNIDKIIARAINHFPENAGPHNPHMLAIKSLMKMNDLSPQYVRRFTVYIETILWLEKNSAKLNPS